MAKEIVGEKNSPPDFFHSYLYHIPLMFFINSTHLVFFFMHAAFAYNILIQLTNISYFGEKT